jgi:hypothetical protein
MLKLKLNQLAKVTFCVLIIFSTNTQAELPDESWSLNTSLYGHHFHWDPNHNDHQELIDLEHQSKEDVLSGLALFKNSFRQQCEYLYIGKSFQKDFEDFNIHLKLTAGVLHGYEGQYRDKIPFNHYGTSPAAIPTVGIQLSKITVDASIYGSAGYLVTGGYKF